MKFLWACTLLLASPALWGQTAAADAFTLKIQAPEEVRNLLERHLTLQRYKVLGDLSDSELDRLLLDAHRDSQDLLATLGYFAPQITLQRTPSARADAPREVLLQVNPGKPTQVQQVQIDFEGAIVSDPQAAAQQAQIRDNWELQNGMRFTQEAWDAAKLAALRRLTTRRYPLGRLSQSRADVQPERYQADLQVDLDSGAAYHLGPLRVTGTQRYEPLWVHALAQLEPGSEYDQSVLVAAQRRLADSGYFDSAYVSLDTSGDPQAAPVLVQLHEAALQKVVLGVGASTDSGARVSVEHTDHRLPWLDWGAVTKLSLDRDTQSLGTELTAPPEDGRWRWTGSMLLQNQRTGTFDVNSQRLRGGRDQTGEHLDQNYYLQYDRADSAASDTTPPSLAESVTANYAFTLRRFDSLPFPSSGWGLGMELGAGTTLGSAQQPFARILSRLQGLVPLDSNPPSSLQAGAGRLVLRGSLGAVVVNDGATVPSTQLFLTGGDTSVRGYAKDAIGISLPGLQTTAGRYLAVGSVEWQRPIFVNHRPSDWESAVFVDAGSVADRPEQLEAKVGVGFGARWKSPIGPLQIDLAYGVADQSVRLHLNVGFSF